MAHKKTTLMVEANCRIHGPYTAMGLSFCHKHVMWVKVCPGCGQAFHTDRKDRATCSDKCRQRVSRKVSQTKV